MGTLELNSLNLSESKANTSGSWWAPNEHSALSPNGAGGGGKSGLLGGPSGGSGRALKQCYKVLITADLRLLVADLSSRAVHAFALEIPESVLQKQQHQHGPRSIAAAAAAMAGADSFLQQIGRPGRLELNGGGGGEDAAASTNGVGHADGTGEKSEQHASRAPEEEAAAQEKQALAQVNVRRLGCVLSDVVVGGWALDPSNSDVYIFDLCTKSLDMYKLLQS